VHHHITVWRALRRAEESALTNRLDDPKCFLVTLRADSTTLANLPPIPWSSVWFSERKMLTIEPRTNGQNNMVWDEREGRRITHKKESKYVPRAMVWVAINETFSPL
jgi:hypothetical protein